MSLVMLLKKLDNYYLLEIALETGRHHQIRSQLATIGCIIKGDLKESWKCTKDALHLQLKLKAISYFMEGFIEDEIKLKKLEDINFSSLL